MTEFEKLRNNFEEKFIPLHRDSAIAYFDASISGSDADYQKSADLETKTSDMLSDPETFAQIKMIKEKGELTDPLEKRELQDLYNSYLSHQVEPAKLEALINLQTEVEKKFATFRAEVKGKSLTDNDIIDLLQNSSDQLELQMAWEESKKVGREVSDDVIKLAKMRNEIAKSVGFNNYHEMSLELDEQSPAEIEKLFDELDLLTGPAFREAKNEIDLFLTKKFSISLEDLRPWHFQDRFFQEAPKIYPVDLDKYYKDKDLVAITEDYFGKIGLPIEDILTRSDLFEKPGKNQHAYCMDTDREGDIRVLCNVKSNLKWMDTMLHEFGHAVYEKFIDPKLPWLLHLPSHTFTTEAVAIFFGALASNSAWLRQNLAISKPEAEKITKPSFQQIRLEKLIFSRWAQVVYRFEKSMYEDPDQDLNDLWWKLVERYQGIAKPIGREEPDWAAKIHLATVPAYYHNYLLGTLLSSQIKASLIAKMPEIAQNGFSNDVEIGNWFKQYIFLPGNRFYWDEMIERATG
ncbi:MAG: M2 family metallopeptidase, partial [Candidatus Berkelbacteria bacterium]|nr:M2 family metallopeptidase [Candidatus Berkelbacteria bacterium]